MPISVLLVGVLLIFLSFNLGTNLIKGLKTKKITVFFIVLSLFIALFIKPVLIGNTALINIGVSIILLIVFTLLLTKLKPTDYFKFASVSIVLLTVILIFNLIMPLGAEQIYYSTALILGSVLGFISYLISYNLIQVMLSIILSTSLFSVINFLIRYIKGLNSKLYLGVGVIFEASIIAVFLSVFLFSLHFVILKINKPKLNKLISKGEDLWKN